MNFIVSILFSVAVITVIALIPLVGVWAFDLRTLFGIVIPYLAFVTFLVGIISRVIGWSRSPVPFRIPTTAGQQWSLPWIKSNPVDNPKNTVGVIIRMIFEVLLFRSLFRNTKMEFRQGPKIGYEWEKWLWLGALAFHYSFLVVVLRHLRFFTDPMPAFVHLLENLDGFLEAGIIPVAGFSVPGLLISGFVLLLAVTFLFLRRIAMPQIRYISLPADYFPLFLILGITATGILMRYGGMFMQYVLNVDIFTVKIVKVKELAMGLVTFHPTVPEGIGTLFFIHLFLVCVLLAYFPFSKLMHMAGIFLSPTRNLSNNNRFVRHVNPWDYPVKTHTYDEYEDEFREKMVEAGLPVEIMPESQAENDSGSQEEEKKE